MALPKLSKLLVNGMVYSSLCILSLFLVNFKEHTAPYPLSFLPNIDRNYTHSFNMHALYAPLSILFVWCVHHSLFIREPVRAFLASNVRLHDKQQLYAYKGLAAILLIASVFSYNSSANPIGGGCVWNIQRISSAQNHWLLRNACYTLISMLLLYTLRELNRLEVVRSDIIITESVYGFVRHPVQLCLLLLLWITPRMTVSRFIFCIVLTVYVLIGLYLEEQTLIKKFGTSYIEYKKNFPALMPHRKIHFEENNDNDNSSDSNRNNDNRKAKKKQ